MRRHDLGVMCRMSLKGSGVFSGHILPPVNGRSQISGTSLISILTRASAVEPKFPYRLCGFINSNEKTYYLAQHAFEHSFIFCSMFCFGSDKLIRDELRPAQFSTLHADSLSRAQFLHLDTTILPKQLKVALREIARVLPVEELSGKTGGSESVRTWCTSGDVARRAITASATAKSAKRRFATTSSHKATTGSFVMTFVSCRCTRLAGAGTVFMTSHRE